MRIATRDFGFESYMRQGVQGRLLTRDSVEFVAMLAQRLQQNPVDRHARIETRQGVLKNDLQIAP